MYIILICLFLLLLSVICYIRNKDSIMLLVLMLFCTFILGAGLLALRADDRKFIRKIESTQITIEQQRNSNSPIERTAVLNIIIDLNTQLSETKFQAKSKWYNWFHDKRILDVQPLK